MLANKLVCAPSQFSYCSFWLRLPSHGDRRGWVTQASKRENPDPDLNDSRRSRQESCSLLELMHLVDAFDLGWGPVPGQSILSLVQGSPSRQLGFRSCACCLTREVPTKGRTQGARNETRSDDQRSPPTEGEDRVPAIGHQNQLAILAQVILPQQNGARDQRTPA